MAKRKSSSRKSPRKSAKVDKAKESKETPGNGKAARGKSPKPSELSTSFTAIKIAGSDAVAKLEEYRKQYRESGQYPFLIGDKHGLAEVQAMHEGNEREPEEIVESSLAIDVAEWIAERSGGCDEDDLFADEEWPDDESETRSMTLHTDASTGKPKREVYLGLIELAEPWQLPALLNFGGWNECPEAEVHCAFLKKWQSAYGAQITGISNDTIECTVAKPPTNRRAAMKLAAEQFWYCNDIVTQGCDTVTNLAAILLKSPYWYFWWD